VKFAAQAGIPVFGVCLGLQGIVEAFGGELGVLDYPNARQAIHDSRITIKAYSKGCPKQFKVGRYTRCSPAKKLSRLS